jgi:RNA polymerase sigma-70 factor (ECF subfamily)
MVEPISDSLPTRHSLLNRLKDWEDRSSWQQFFDLYWRLIYNVGRHAGLNDAESQDLVQETVLGVAKNIGAFNTDPARGSFKAWLMHQTRWRIADQMRRRGPANPTPQAGPGRPPNPAEDSGDSTGPAEGVTAADGELEAVWDHEWQRHVMHGALERLKGRVSARQYQLFDLHVLQGLSVGETARTMGVSQASVYMAKYRLSRLLHEECERLDQAAEE